MNKNRDLFPVTCAYLNKTETIDESELDMKEGSLLAYCALYNYKDTDILWFVDEDPSCPELMKLLQRTDNGLAYNLMIIHDWNQIPAHYMNEVRRAVLDARLDVVCVLFLMED